jgi:dephospho-CoA kinase
MSRPRDKAPWRVALTGGVASGKSSVAKLFSDLGIPVIDTDEIAHALTRRGQPALDRIAAAFGPGVLDARGELDRRGLRARIYGDAAQRRKLEAILHPMILEETERRSAAARGPYQVVVVPLLYEAGLEGRFDRVLVVDAPEAEQVRRLRARDGETTAGAERMLAAQMPRSERLSRADDVIRNDGTLAELAERVAALHAHYVQLAQDRKNSLCRDGDME